MKKLIPLAQVEQLIDEMQEECLQLKPWEWGLSKRDALQDLRNKLSSLPTEESGWIACKDEMPEEEWEYQIFDGNSHAQTISFYDPDRRKFSQDYLWCKITHWMEKPKPPLQ